MSHYKPYPAYKDSGVEWLGKVPEHWVIQKLKWFASLQSGDFITSDSIKDDGAYPVYGGNGQRGYSEAFTHSGDYVLIGRQGALCGNINYASGDFWASEHAVVVSPYKKAVTRWLGELLRSMNLNQYSVSAAQPGLAVERIIDLEIPVAPLNEQQAIAAHLDRETARIDALITKKTRFIELLREKRQALITHAVTKGLDPNVKMKDSGVEWLGEVPEHWEIKPFKWYIDRNDGGVWGDDPDGASDTIVLRSTEQTVDGNWKLEEPALRKLSQVDREFGALKAGDLLVTKSSGSSLHIGKTSLVTPEIEDLGCCYSNFMQRIRVKSSIIPRLAWFVMNNDLARRQFDFLSSSTTGLANLNGSMIGQLIISVAPKVEQEKILAHLDRETARIDALIGKSGRSIELLKERRSALITAAVTGQIDLREAA